MTTGITSVKAFVPVRHRTFTRHNQQLISLFVCNFVICFIGAGLMPIVAVILLTMTSYSRSTNGR